MYVYDTPSELLNDYLKGSNKSSINEEIARFFIAYLNEIPNLKITEIADKCHVSTTSIIRFFRELGYLDFTDFKKCIEETNLNNKLRVYRNDFLKNSKGTEGFKDWIYHINNKVLDSLLVIDLDKVDELAKDIINYRYVYIFGSCLSKVVGEYLRVQLARLNKNIITITAPKKDSPLTHNKKDTLGIVLSQHNNYIQSKHEIIPYLQGSCDKTWLITQQEPEESYQKHFNSTLFVNGCNEIIVEYHVMLSVSEIIAEYCFRNSKY